jgi:hypothetical protein
MKWERASYLPVTVEQLMWKFGITRGQAEREKKAQEQALVYLSKTYQVEKNFVTIMGADGWHLSIKRRDKKPIHDWRDLQEIKNDLIGPENEGIEIYPAESRKVDTANQFHLWVMADPKKRIACGFWERMIDDGTGEFGANANGGSQRPFKESARGS